MNDPLPPEIETEETLDQVRYRLPPRQLGGLRLVGLFPLLLGMGMVVFSLVWTAAGTLALPWGGQDPLAWAFGVGTVVFGIPFLLLGWWLVRLGMIVLSGRAELVLAGGRLRATERSGLFRWTRQRALAGLRRFVVGHSKASRKGSMASSLEGLGALAATFENGKWFLVTLGYPRGWLRALADDLARRCNRSGEAAGSTGELVVVQVAEEDGALPTNVTKTEGFQERHEQPVGSEVILEEHANGVTLTVPPRGLWRGSKGLFVFALMWLAITAPVTAGFAAAIWGGQHDAWIGIVALAALFWPVGIGLLLAAINMGRRQAVLAVVGDTLMVMQTGLFGGKQREWQRDLLADVRPGPSGMTVNDVPVLELQIHPREGGKFGMLAGHDDADLAWMATVLLRSLRLSQGTEP